MRGFARSHRGEEAASFPNKAPCSHGKTGFFFFGGVICHHWHQANSDMVG